MRALVTGGTGFLGSHIARALLARGDDVVVFDHRLRRKGLSEDELRRTTAIEGDIRDADAVRQAAEGCKVIFHCAAMVGTQAYIGVPIATMETEEFGLRNVVLAALEGSGVRVIYASSSAAYGVAGDVCLSEDLVAAPVSNYGIAKRFNEMYLSCQHDEHGLESTAVRIFNIYGPGQDERLVIPRFIRCAHEREDLVVYGDGSQTRDFVFVSDVVDTMLACAGRLRGHNIINACSGMEVSVRELAELTIRLSGSGARIAYRRQPPERASFERARCYGSRDRLMRMISPEAAITIEEGMRRTIASYEACFAAHPGSQAQ